jgi:hypothetical protein
MPTSISLSARNTHTSVAITTTEDTITFVDHNGEARDRVIEWTCPQNWAIGTATGSFASKKPIAATIPFRISSDSSITTFYIHAATTSGNLSIWVL